MRVKGVEADAHDVAAQCLRVNKGFEKASADAHDVGRRGFRLATFRSPHFEDIAHQIAERRTENKAEAATRNPRGLRFSHLNVDCCGHHFASSRVPFHNLVLLANRSLSRCCQAL